jgi:DNA-binding NarL/FixJ family response regulator
LREVVAQLPRLLSADHACAFLVRRRETACWLEFFHGAQMPAGLRAAYARWLQTAPRSFDSYDPERPDPRQRNIPLRLRDVQRLAPRAPTPMVRSFLPRFALSECDQLRVLVCEGPVLLAWVGAFRAGSFGRDEVRLLAGVVPALQRRLAFERRLSGAQQRAGAIALALESVPAAVFVVGRTGAVLHANEAGRAMLDRDRRGVEAQVAAALRGTGSALHVAALDPQSELRLAVLQRRTDAAPLVLAARARWQLTPRQTEVLQLVGQGLSNRAVAAALRCAESTVELHVTALLARSRCESRAQLVARLWSGG